MYVPAAVGRLCWQWCKGSATTWHDRLPLPPVATTGPLAADIAEAERMAEWPDNPRWAETATLQWRRAGRHQPDPGSVSGTDQCLDSGRSCQSRRPLLGGKGFAATHHIAWKLPGSDTKEPAIDGVVKLDWGGSAGELSPTRVVSTPNSFSPWVGCLGRAHGIYLDCALEGITCRALVDTGFTLWSAQGSCPTPADHRSRGGAPQCSASLLSSVTMPRWWEPEHFEWW